MHIEFIDMESTKMEFIRRNYFISAFFICLLITAAKLAALYIVKIPLWVDEAQYWGWSKELAMGYYSKPPFIAYLINASTELLGNNLFGVRTAAPVIHFITAIFVFLIAKDLYGKKVGFFSAISYITMPAVAFSSSFISTDAPLIMFWTLALFFLIHATKYKPEHTHMFLWILFSFAVGFGMLSKYTMAAFVILSGIYILMTQKGARIFRIDFWMAMIFAGLIFMPNVMWNYDNGFASFIHTSENVVAGKSGGGLKFGDMMEFLGGQFAVMGPFMLILFAISLFKRDELIRTDAVEKQNKNILILYSLPLLLIGLVISLISGAQAHWAAPAYVTAVILTVRYLIYNKKNKCLYIALTINIFLFALSLNARIPASIADAVSGKDPLQRVRVWYRLEKPINDILARYPDAVIVSNERKIIATMMYDLRDAEGNPRVIYKWNPGNKMQDHYDLTKTFRNETNQPVIFLSRSDVIGELRNRYGNNIEMVRQPTDFLPFYIYLINKRMN